MTLSEKLIKWSFHQSVRFINRFHGMEAMEEKVTELRNFEKGTLGRDIADCLDAHGLTLVPGYESHDLKHVLLGYDMTPVDEIRLQAFMLGNGNITVASVAIFFYGALLLPGHWLRFYLDFRLGLRSLPIRDWSIATHGHSYTQSLRMQVFHSKEPAQKSSLLHLLPTLLIFLGLAGMLYSFPYLFSSLLEDLVGAGLAFVAGAMLLGAGVIGKCVLARKAGPEADLQSQRI